MPKSDNTLHLLQKTERSVQPIATELPDLSEVQKVLETVLLTATEPLTTQVLSKLFEPPLSVDLTRRIVETVQTEWRSRSVQLVQVASGWRFQAQAKYQEYIAKLNPEKPPQYSRSVLEILAIIAYRQPITRSEIEAIRGVAVSSQALKTLEQRDWVETVGHREIPGRPALWATTKTFLDDLNLRSLAELPPLADLDLPLSSFSEIQTYDFLQQETSAPSR